MNDFLKEPLNWRHIRNAINDIDADLHTLHERIDTIEKAGGNLAEEEKATLTLSGLELKLTNFTQDIRRKLA